MAAPSSERNSLRGIGEPLSEAFVVVEHAEEFAKAAVEVVNDSNEADASRCFKARRKLPLDRRLVRNREACWHHLVAVIGSR